MKFHGLRLSEGSTIKNATVDSGASFPLQPSEGELFYLTGPGEALYVYNGATWLIASPEFDANGDYTINGNWTFAQPVSIPSPTLPTHAVDRQYVDGLVSGASLTPGAGLSLTANTLNIGTASAARIVVNADTIDLATVGTAGTYNSVTTDAYGRVTAGTNPTTLSGYGITDAQPLNGNLTSLSLISGSGLLRRDAPDLWSLDTNVYLTGNQNITVTGDATGSGSTSIALTLANVNSNVGVFGSSTETAVITVNSKGLITSVTTAPISVGVSSFSVTGDVSGVLNGGVDELTLATVNSAPVTDALAKVTVNAKGLVTATSPVVESDLAALLDTRYVNTTGDTMTGTLTISVPTWDKWVFETTGVTAKTRQASDANGLNFTTNARWTGGAWQEDDATRKKFAYIQHLGNGRHEFRTAVAGAGASWITSLALTEDGATVQGNMTVTANTTVDGQLFLSRQDTALEGGQVNLRRASDNANAYGIDVYGSGTTPRLRFINLAGSNELLSLNTFGAIGVGALGTDFGTVGQVLTSQGPSAPPIWQAPGTAVIQDVLTATVNCAVGTHYTLDSGVVQTNFVLPTALPGDEVTISDFSGRVDTEVQSTAPIMDLPSPFIINVVTPVTLTFRYVNSTLGWVLV